MQTVCAFANEPNINYGYLLLGISEPDECHDNYWISGVEDTDKVLNDLQNNCRNQFENTIQIDAGILTLENKKVVVVKVFELDAASKPCGFKSSGKKIRIILKLGYGEEALTAIMKLKLVNFTTLLLLKLDNHLKM